MTAAAWHPDPTGRHELRYWDGTQWTDHVSDQGVQGVSPLYPSSDGGSTGSSAGTEAESSAGSHRADDAADDRAGQQGGQDPMATQQMDMTDLEPETAFAPVGADRLPMDEQVPVAESRAAEPASAEEPVSGQPQMGAQPPIGQAPYAAQPYGGQPQGGPSYAGQPTGSDPALADAFAGISGDLISGQYSERGGIGAELQNKKLLRVRIDQPFMAKQGSMVAYQGNINFAYQGGGAAKFLKKALTGEGLNLMRVEGQGDVFLADAAHDVHILHLNNSGISANGKNVLAFSASLDWNVERVKGGSIAAGGLFNTTLRGTGWVAVTTDGEPVVLNAAEAPTFADANALVCWSVNLHTSIKSSVTAGALIGRGSGEAFQVSFQGPGFVIVQPSEGPVAPPAA